MFPLHTQTFPSSAAELTTLLNESLDRLFSTASTPVTIQDASYPDLAELKITLDGAKLRADPPKPPVAKGATSPGIHTAQLQLNAARIALGPGMADVHLNARDVRLDQAQSENGDIILVLKSASDGHVEISAAQQELESLIAVLAQAEAGKQGVAIERVQLTLRQRGERNLTAEVQLHARKLFFSTVVRITADLDLDEQLNATISGLTCQGDGAIGSLACGFLEPHLKKIDGRVFSLLALPLGDIQLRDVRLSVREKITVTAEFGSV